MSNRKDRRKRIRQSGVPKEERKEVYQELKERDEAKRRETETPNLAKAGFVVAKSQIIIPGQEERK